MTITRRTALATLLAGGAASCSSVPKRTPFVADNVQASGQFSSGVASGDPRADAVIIWTRIGSPIVDSPAGSVGGTALPGNQTVTWAVARDAAFTDIVAEGTETTGPARDGTVKVDVQGLAPGTSYHYRFDYEGERSPIGRTRTLPVGETSKARFAVISCSNYPFGHFNVYDQIARVDDLDAVLHVGDYIYEYGRDGYGGDIGEAIGRGHMPPTEILTLADYRRRHRQYKSDPSSQAMHARHPLIPIWDDHETANNSWKDGAQNHDPKTEGDWTRRRTAALQAYYEWMPVRDPVPGMAREAFFRSFSYGNLMSLAAIETRLMARDQELSYREAVAGLKTPDDVARYRREVLNNPDRQMLGTAQLDYLEKVLDGSKQSGQPWRVVANQIIMAKVDAPDLTPYVTEEEIVALEQEWDQARAFIQASTLGLPTNFDAWDGYPAARERFFDMVKSTTNAEGLIVLTGDTHTWWANDLTDAAGGPVGVELGVASVTSPSPYREEFLGGKGADYALLTNRHNKDVRYLNGTSHGYIDLTVTPEATRARFVSVDNTQTTAYNAFDQAAFTISRRAGPAAFSDADGLSFKQGFLF
ncbi:MAG: alkaline phosphatase D family protein [Pseudomonadota bacterium]